MRPARHLRASPPAPLMRIALVVLVVAAGCSPRAKWPQAAPPSAPVTITTDIYGIPHIRAANLPDLYFAWGWVTARDRAWQLVLTRAQAQGRSHLFLGNKALQADGGAQLFRLRERADSIWAREKRDPKLRQAVERYTDGINAWLRERGAQASSRGEFATLHLRPEPWRPEDTILLLLGLGVTLDLDLPEMAEASALRRHSATWLEARHQYESEHIFDTIPDSATGTVPARAAPLAARALAATAAPLPAAMLPEATLAQLANDARAWPSHEPDGSDRASNEFAVGPRRTASGMPILANDPHLSLTTPGPFHVVHLFVPGVLDAAGAAVPGLPAIVTGRNENCAWGVTALSADVIDLYADSLSADGRHVRWQGRWAPVVTRGFDLQYRLPGGLRVPVPAFAQARRYTPHGPVITWDPKHHLALSARWSAFEDTRITVARLVGIERSTSAAEVAERYRSLVTPTINLAVADAEGDVRYQSTGLVPVRHHATMLGPLPSDGRHEWDGFIPADSMPAWRVPANGYFVNANNRPRSDEPWGHWDWVNDRAARMSQRLAPERALTLERAADVQNDVFSRAGERSNPLLIANAESLSAQFGPREQAALDTLRAWNFMAKRGFVAPTINRAWWSAFVRLAGTDGLPGLSLAILQGRVDIALWQPTETKHSPPRVAVDALKMALDTLGAKLGPDMSQWKWQRAHIARFGHPLERLGGIAWEAPGIAVDGDGSTISVAGSHIPWDFDVTHGSAFRHVVDVAIRDSSLAVIPPWNSDAFRLDHRVRWADHRYVPLLRNWGLIEERVLDRVVLGVKE